MTITLHLPDWPVWVWLGLFCAFFFAGSFCGEAGSDLYAWFRKTRQ